MIKSDPNYFQFNNIYISFWWQIMNVGDNYGHQQPNYVTSIRICHQNVLINIKRLSKLYCLLKCPKISYFQKTFEKSVPIINVVSWNQLVGNQLLPNKAAENADWMSFLGKCCVQVLWIWGQAVFMSPFWTDCDERMFSNNKWWSRTLELKKTPSFINGILTSFDTKQFQIEMFHIRSILRKYQSMQKRKENLNITIKFI